MGIPHNKVMVKYRTGQVTGGKMWREEQPSKTPRDPQQTGHHVDVLKHGYESSETQQSERGDPCQVITSSSFQPKSKSILISGTCFK